MILVDTSFWINYFRNKDKIVLNKLDSFIEKNRIYICGIILQEILQGIYDEKAYALTKKLLMRLPFINTNIYTYIMASDIYKTMRKKGFSIPTIDILIATIAIQYKYYLLSIDNHFKLISKYTNLKLLSV